MGGAEHVQVGGGSLSDKRAKSKSNNQIQTWDAAHLIRRSIRANKSLLIGYLNRP